jgi:signal peptidase I
MKIVLKIVNHIVSAVLVLVLICSFYIMLSSKITGGQPSIFGNQLMLVLSGSMEPNIATGSVVGVKAVDDKTSLKKDDIITFYSPIKENTIVTHRIIDIKGTGEFTEYITKGDNNQTEDPRPVPAQKVIGKFSGLEIPYLGYVLQFLQSKSGIALSLIIPGLILIIYNVISLWRAFSEAAEGKESNDAQQTA